MSEFSRETLLNIIETDHVQCGEASALARMALAAMDSEPVAWRRFQETPTDGGYWILYDYKPNCSGVEPLYRHAQPAPKVMQIETAIADCDPEVYEKGVSVCLVAIPKETAEVICQNITAATGCKVDWHYFGGRVHIKALRESSQSAPVVPDAYVRDEHGRMMLNGVCEPKIGFGTGWNACRAAMLSGGKS